MAAQWDQTIEHVFNSSSITSIMKNEYPAVYKLMLEELESVSTYMGWMTKMKSIPFQSALSSKHDESHLIQSVTKCLEAELPSAAREKIGRFVADKCLNCLSSLSAIPPGKPCMIASRVDGLDDWNSNSLFWSCGVDLNLLEGESTSTRSPSKVFRLGGNFNLSILACDRGILDKIDTHARKDYNEVKNTIMNACPRLPLFSPGQRSIQSNHRSLSIENDSALRSSSTARNNEVNDERLMLRSRMASYPDSVIICLEIRKHQLSSDALLELLYHMQDYINHQLPASKVFIVQDYLIVVYPQNMTASVTEIMRDFDSNGRFFTLNDIMDDKQVFKRSIHEANIDLATNILMLNKYEDISIIWFDDNIEREIKQSLENLHDHILFYLTIDQVIDSINNKIENHKIILIVRGKHSRQTLDSLHENSKVDSFYIFCMNEQFYQDLIDDKKYSKLIGIYTEYSQLIRVLEKRLHLLLKHLAIFKLFINNNRSIRDLEQESIAYSWYQLLRDTLMRMNNQKSKQEMLEYCRSYFYGDELKEKQIDQFDRTYKSTEAIRWYTKNHFPFDFVNKALRTEDVMALYYLRYFIVDICTNLKLLFNQNVHVYQEIFDIFEVYRGLTLPDKDIDQLKNSIGKFVSTNGFLSTSLTCKVAETFANNVLFHIKIDTSLNSIIYASISHLSMIPDEDEVLFDLGATFQITNVNYDGKKWIVTMIGVDNVDSLKNDFLALKRQDMLTEAREKNIKTNFSFGSFLTDLGHYNQAIMYFQNLLHQIPDEDKYDKYYVFQYLADAHHRNKQTDLSLDYLMKAYDMGLDLIATGTNQPMSLPSILKSIGVIYTNRNQLILAFDYLKKAMERIDKNDLKLVSEIHQALARLYLCKQDYIHSAKHCEQSLEILNLFYPDDIFSISDRRETLGEIYYEMGNYVIALEHLQESFQITKTMYPPDNHPSIARMHRLLSCICLETEQYDFSIDYSEKALRYEQKIRLNSYDTMVSLYNIIGYSYCQKKQYDKAIEYYMQSLQIITEKHVFKNGKMTAFLNSQIGLCHFENDSHILALEYYLKSLELYEKLPIEDVSDKIIDLGDKLVHLYYNIEEYDLCIEQLQRTMSLAENFMDKNQLSLWYFRIGSVIGKTKNEYDLAIKYLKLSLEIEENNQINSLEYRQQVMLTIYIKLAWFYYQNDQYHFAIEYYENVLKLFRKYPITAYDVESKLSTIYECLAISYVEIQKYHSAIDYFKQSLKIFNIESTLTTHDTQLHIAELHQRIANCTSKMEQHHLSIEHYQVALEIYENIDQQDQMVIAILYNNIGWDYGKIGQYDLGLQYCIKSRSMFEKSLEFQHVCYAYVHNSLAVIYYHKGNFDQACRNCMKSIEICNKGKYTAIPENFELLGNVFRRYGATILANSCYLKALKLFKSSTPASFHDIERIQELLI